MTQPTTQICVYCSSSDDIKQVHRELARETGALMAARGIGLVYGGGDVGLMGEVARSVHEGGGYVYGVIPHALREIEGVAYELADELVVTDTMSERKTLMFERADGYLVLPGGPGTLEEFFEVLTLGFLGYHDKPIALLAKGDYWQPLEALFEHLYAENMAREGFRRLHPVFDDAAAALDHVCG